MLLVDILGDVIGECINDNALEDRVSENLYYAEDDFGMLIKKLQICVTTAVLEWHGKQVDEMIGGAK